MRLLEILTKKLGFITPKRNEPLFEIYHNHLDTEELVVEILHQIGSKEKMSAVKVKKMLLIDENQRINDLFWRILDTTRPGHGYNYVGCCSLCGSLELKKQL